MNYGKGGFFMQKSNNTEKRSVRLSAKKICTVGLLISFSVAIGWVCKTYLTFGAIRVTFENIPIILSGILFGPGVGCIVGILSDAVSCVTSPNPALNPIISAGAALIGIIPGIISRYVIKKNRLIGVPVCVFLAHIVGSMIVKSIGLYVFFGYGFEVLWMRIPLYLAISVGESVIIYSMLKNKYISDAIPKRI